MERDADEQTGRGIHTGVCEKSTPPEQKALGTIGMKITQSGAGEQFLPQDCKAKAYTIKLMFHRHQ